MLGAALMEMGSTELAQRYDWQKPEALSVEGEEGSFAVSVTSASELKLKADSKSRLAGWSLVIDVDLGYITDD